MFGSKTENHLFRIGFLKNFVQYITVFFRFSNHICRIAARSGFAIELQIFPNIQIWLCKFYQSVTYCQKLNGKVASEEKRQDLKELLTRKVVLCFFLELNVYSKSYPGRHPPSKVLHSHRIWQNTWRVYAYCTLTYCCALLISVFPLLLFLCFRKRDILGRRSRRRGVFM